MEASEDEAIQYEPSEINGSQPHSTSTSSGCSAVPFFVGQEFRTFEDLDAHIKKYESEHYVQLWRRDSRTVEAARKRMNRPLSDEIKYYEVTYLCIHGGKKFKARGEEKRATS